MPPSSRCSSWYSRAFEWRFMSIDPHYYLIMTRLTAADACNSRQQYWLKSVYSTCQCICSITTLREWTITLCVIATIEFALLSSDHWTRDNNNNSSTNHTPMNIPHTLCDRELDLTPYRTCETCCGLSSQNQLRQYRHRPQHNHVIIDNTKTMTMASTCQWVIPTKLSWRATNTVKNHQS
jgi:hypothetical protein